MLSSYPVSCPYEGCGWCGNLVPSLLRGGADAEIGRMQRAWFHCPGCQRDWEVRISDDRVFVVPAAEPRPALGEWRNVARRKDSVPMARAPDTQVCPQCGCANRTAGMKTPQVEMRPVLTPRGVRLPGRLGGSELPEVRGVRLLDLPGLPDRAGRQPGDRPQPRMKSGSGA